MLDYSSSVEGVIWSFCMEVLPRDFHFHPVDSALSVEKNYYSSIYSNTIGKMITHTHTQTNTDIQTDRQTNNKPYYYYKKNIQLIILYTSLAIILTFFQ